MTPKATWQQQIKAGTLIEDENQKPVIEALDNLFIALQNSEQQAPAKIKLPFLFKKKTQINAPKGLYIWGSVGRGKSMLMDLFAEKLGSELSLNVSRRHFHEFMRHIQSLLIKNREAYRSFDNPLIPLASEIATQSRVLCFDEFQVTNIADAMILGRLFEALFNNGVTIVATSNIAPQNLYKDGLHRSRFLPFIEILKDNMHILQMGGAEDFRHRHDILEDAWLAPLTQENQEKFDALFHLQAGQDEPLQNLQSSHILQVDSRSLPLIKAYKNIAMLSFNTLCREPRGTADYIALAKNFHTLYLTDIPKLTHEGAAVRRFIHLIDILYENRIRLHMLAQCKAEALAPPPTDSEVFFRTLSRLTEMRSAAWQAHSIEAWKA